MRPDDLRWIISFSVSYEGFTSLFTGAARSTAWTPTGPILQTVYVFMR